MFAEEHIHYNEHTHYRFGILHLSTTDTAVAGGGGDVRDVALELGQTRNYFSFSFVIFSI